MNCSLVYKLTPQKGRFADRAPNPLTTAYNRASQGGTESQTAFEKDRTRPHLRDEKHAALAVLMDNELLVTYALASREVRHRPTLPYPIAATITPQVQIQSN